MFQYKAFGLNISSEIKLPGMIEIDNNKFDIKISIGKVNLSIHKPVVKGHNYIADHEDVYIWWDEIGKVKINKGNQIMVEPLSDLENSDETNIIPFLLGPVISTLLYQRGLLVLHGSSVKINNEAVAFLGHKGLGKSTTAIQLYKEGYSIITDDILAIDFDEEGLPIIYPGYPHVRLSDDSYEYIKNDTNILTPIRTYAGKLFCDASRGFSQEPVKLKKIYVLEEGTKNQLSDLKSQESLIELIRHSIPNWIFQKSDQAKNLAQCALLTKYVEIHRFKIVHSFKDVFEII
jgi:Serine kinase of the HPr protein, regulates carbohydrate metabolism